MLVDIGYKSEGVVAREEFLDHQGNLTVKRGDEVDVLIKSLENQDGYAILSRAAAMQVQSWERLRHAHQTHETIKGRVVERIKGGLKVDLDGVRRFFPARRSTFGRCATSKVFRTRRSKSASSSSTASAATSSSRARRCSKKSPNKKKAETLGQHRRRRGARRHGQEHHRLRRVY